MEAGQGLVQVAEDVLVSEEVVFGGGLHVELFLVGQGGGIGGVDGESVSFGEGEVEVFGLGGVEDGFEGGGVGFGEAAEGEEGGGDVVHAQVGGFFFEEGVDELFVVFEVSVVVEFEGVKGVCGKGDGLVRTDNFEEFFQS